MKDFMDDLEEDPEMRQSIQLYKNKKVVDDLEHQLAQLSLTEEKSCKSPLE